MNVRFVSAATLVAILFVDTHPAVAQAIRAEGELSVRVYQLADMILPLPNHGYRPNDLPTTPAGNASEQGGTGSVFGSGGGGLGGGGAAFNFQSTGGGGLGGLPGRGANPAGGGLGTFAGGEAPSWSADEATSVAMNDVADLVRASIEPDSWDETGGPGTIRSYRSMLIISQTAAVHAKIGEFLDVLREQTGTLRTVTVAAYWLMLDSEKLSLLQVERDGVSSIDRETLAKYAKEEGNYRGQITCFSGQTVHLVGGMRRNVVTSVIPVVGGDNPAYQPRGGTPNMGVLLQVRPTLVAEQNAAIVDLQSWVTAAPKTSQMVEFHSGATSAGGPSVVESTQGADEKAVATGEVATRVDRLDIASQALATTLRAPVGTPVLVGGLTDVSSSGAKSDAGERKQLYVVVQVNVAEHSRAGADASNAKGGR
jgi:hypothetical protein